MRGSRRAVSPRREGGPPERNVVLGSSCAPAGTALRETGRRVPGQAAKTKEKPVLNAVTIGSASEGPGGCSRRPAFCDSSLRCPRSRSSRETQRATREPMEFLRNTRISLWLGPAARPGRGARDDHSEDCWRAFPGAARGPAKILTHPGMWSAQVHSPPAAASCLTATLPSGMLPTARCRVRIVGGGPGVMWPASEFLSSSSTHPCSGMVLPSDSFWQHVPFSCW